MHAVIFTGGDICSNENLHKILSRYENKIFYAADSGLEYFNSYELYCKKNNFNLPVLKCILGDMDSLKDLSLLQKYKNIPLQKFMRDKDFTDTELAVFYADKFLKDNSFCENKIILCGGGGGCLSHLLTIYDSFSTSIHPDVWIQKEECIYFIKKNSFVEILDLKCDDNVSVFRLSSSRKKGKFFTDGFIWESDVFRKKGLPSIRNRIKKEYFDKEKNVKFCVKKTDCLLSLPFDAQLNSCRNKNN